MSLMSRIAKKIARRFRTKGTHYESAGYGINEAQFLIQNNWNISNNSPEPERKGLYRAIDRLTAKRKANAKISYPEIEPTRQVFRHMARRKVKQHRMLETVKFTRKNG
jgi:hypothetical protein